MDYIEFANKSVEAFKEIQQEFRENFKIDDYTNWYYNQATELLTLSTVDNQINFRYIPIGTYSEKTTTWMWSWENKNSIEKSKKEVLIIKKFGEENHFPKLAEGYFESDKYDGWEFVAISNKLIGGIGGYRIKSDHLEIYMLVTALIDNATAAKIKAKAIDCETHGANRIAFVCQHLINSEDKGFEEAFPTYKGMELDEEEDLQAWCDECEIERLRTDGWNDESLAFAKIKLVCEDCYFEIKEKNLKK